MGYYLPFNQIKDIDEETVALVVSNKLHGEVEVLIDRDDLDKVSGLHWNIVKHNNVLYCRASSRKHLGTSRSFVFIHRLILGNPRLVDHKNGNGLDNRKSNLREATHSQNSMNRDYPRSVNQYRGVTFVRPGKFQARITVNGKRESLGYFSSDSEAALAYNQASKKLHGEFGRLNVV